ncbi:hypothetical protein Tco_1094257 [Tanacetum coccineum]|uniref:Reverse transcriptase domain-containing protein n=1 Tax=Tanacetum coccineum TaxID=301880 RepID=A0ABQ5IF03_9ASTR
MPKNHREQVQSFRQSLKKAIVAGNESSSSTPGISSDVAELKDMVKALLLDKKNQSQAPAAVKAVEESCVTCGGAYSHRNCPATNGNVYRDNIQEYMSQAAAVNDNQGNTGYRPPMIANQVRPPGFPPVHGVSKTDFESYVKANDAVMQNMQSQMTNITTCTPNLNSNTLCFSTSGSGSLPSNTIANPKGDVKAITTQSGVSYNGTQIPPSISSLPKEMENEPEVTKVTVQPSTKNIQPLEVQTNDQNGAARFPNLPPSPVCEINVPEKIKSSCEDPPDLELKDLPSHLEYAFLEGDDKLPVIIAKNLKDEDKTNRA